MNVIVNQSEVPKVQHLYLANERIVALLLEENDRIYDIKVFKCSVWYLK